jgi:hypothetical protein
MSRQAALHGCSCCSIGRSTSAWRWPRARTRRCPARRSSDAVHARPATTASGGVDRGTGRISFAVPDDRGLQRAAPATAPHRVALTDDPASALHTVPQGGGRHAGPACHRLDRAAAATATRPHGSRKATTLLLCAARQLETACTCGSCSPRLREQRFRRRPRRRRAWRRRPLRQPALRRGRRHPPRAIVTRPAARTAFVSRPTGSASGVGARAPRHTAARAAPAGLGGRADRGFKRHGGVEEWPVPCSRPPRCGRLPVVDDLNAPASTPG